MKRSLLITIILGIAVWAVVTWPLPTHFTSAVPYSEKRAEADSPVVAFVPGDHIQLMYHFWLFRDMVAGKTPAFSNVYEFNTDGDGRQKKFDTYYVPFSAVYALVSPLFGDAAGWNAAGLFSHFLGMIGIFLLARRIGASNLAASAIAVATSAFPYRWITLTSGSPTGFAMCFVPWLFLGILGLVRDGSVRSGAIAGAALFFSYCSDLHVFYFSSLVSPFAVLAFLPMRGPDSPPLKKSILAALPFIAFGMAAIVLSRISASNLDKSTMAAGRTLSEVKLFSPIASGIIRREVLAGASNQIYIGFYAIAAMLLGACAFASRRDNFKDKGKWIPAALFAIAAAGIYLLALGAYGPLDALPIRIARKFVPKYTMIRQSAKIFCLLPSVMAIVAAIFWSARSKWRAMEIAALILALGMLTEEASWFSPGLCRLPKTMPTYETIAENASGQSPKAVCATLWPGDSHWSSVYEYGVMHSRLRLLNGYSPSVPSDYMERVFRPLMSLNEGVLTKEQIGILEGFGVGFVIFHENPYPSKVAPFSAGVAMRELSANPYLRFISHEDGAAGYEILADASTATGIAPTGGKPMPYLAYPASWQWNGQRVKRSIDTAPKGKINIAFRAPVSLRPKMRFLLLGDGRGWFDIPLDNPMGGVYDLPEGTGKIKHMLLTAGEYPCDFTLPIELTPAWMFHEGTSSIADGSVSFSPGKTRHGIALRGPDLPIPHGRYTLEVKATGDGMELASISCGVIGDEAKTYSSTGFSADGTARLSFVHDSDFPFEVQAVYGGGRLTLTSIVLTKQQDDERHGI